jgi:poly-beta-1,6-N-acetyl-D-glucosamine synthase
MGKKVQNFLQIKYPQDKLEVVFVDGGSQDGTVKELEKSLANVSYTSRIIEQGSRKGFNSAVVEGFQQTTGDIIFITGAETEYEPNAVRLIVDHFADPNVGAVNGTMRINNLGDALSTKIEESYRNYYDFLREAESKMDSLFDIKGEIAAARRNICQHLVDKSSLLKRGCIDACFSFQAKEDNFISIYEPRAVYYEPAPEKIRDSFKQQIRRGATLIENMLSFRNLIFKRRYGKFGMVIMPAHFMMLLVLPFLFVASILGVLTITIFNPINYLLLGVIIAALIVFVVSRGVQAFVKVQVVLIYTVLKMLLGIDTQKFERLKSVRPT